MRTRKLINLSLVLVYMMFTSFAAVAGFSTYSKDWPNDAAVVKENDPTVAAAERPKIANADLIEDNNNTNDRVSEDGRLYVKFGGNFNSAKIYKIKNYSYNTLANSTVNNDSVRSDYISWEVGAGSKTKTLRYEVEYVHTKNVTYNANPIFNSGSERLTSVVMNKNILLNIFYDFKNFSNLNFEFFRPYVGVLTGIAWNKTRSTMQGGVGTNVAKNGNKVGAAWGLSFGARMPFYSRWTAYFGYRFIKQPKVLWKDNTSVLLLKGKYVLQSFNVGVSYLI